MARCRLCDLVPSRTVRYGVAVCEDCADAVDSGMLPELDHDSLEQYQPRSNVGAE